MEFRTEYSTLQRAAASKHWPEITKKVRNIRVDLKEHVALAAMAQETGVESGILLPVKVACLPNASQANIKLFHELRDAANAFASNVDHVLNTAVMLNKGGELLFLTVLQSKHKVMAAACNLIMQILVCQQLGKTGYGIITNSGLDGGPCVWCSHIAD